MQEHECVNVIETFRQYTTATLLCLMNELLLTVQLKTLAVKNF